MVFLSLRNCARVEMDTAMRACEAWSISVLTDLMFVFVCFLSVERILSSWVSCLSFSFVFIRGGCVIWRAFLARCRGTIGL